MCNTNQSLPSLTAHFVHHFVEATKMLLLLCVSIVDIGMYISPVHQHTLALELEQLW